MRGIISIFAMAQKCGPLQAEPAFVLAHLRKQRRQGPGGDYPPLRKGLVNQPPPRTFLDLWHR
jgi:hypothetical protein